MALTALAHVIVATVDAEAMEGPIRNQKLVVRSFVIKLTAFP
jgi:hypothetical protein